MTILNSASLKKFGQHAQWLFFICMTFFIALAISWLLLAKVNFAYPVLYDYAGIAENITQFASKNTIKPHFDQSSRTEHLALFNGIVHGIHHHGDGLETLTYQPEEGKVIFLLTTAEVVHLQDVANLYDTLKGFVLIVVFMWWLLVALHHRRQMKLSTKALWSYTLLLPVIFLVVMAMGAEKLFYQLHTLIFPAEHQWFFYYEESLMSMMMKAPDLFAYIAVMLLLLAVIFTGGSLWFYRRYLN